MKKQLTLLHIKQLHKIYFLYSYLRGIVNNRIGYKGYYHQVTLSYIGVTLEYITISYPQLLPQNKRTDIILLHH